MLPTYCTVHVVVDVGSIKCGHRRFILMHFYYALCAEIRVKDRVYYEFPFQPNLPLATCEKAFSVTV